MALLDRRTFISKTTKGLALLPFVSLFSGCKTKDKGTFHIGFLTPKTGIDAKAGLSCERGAKIAESFFKQIGLEGKVTIVDTESNIESASLKTQKLIQNGVHCLVGAFNSAASAAIGQIANDHKIPYIIDLSVADQLTEQGHSFVFRNFPTSSQIGHQSVGCIKNLFLDTDFKIKTATLLVLNDPYGQTMLNAFKKEEDSLPFKIEEVIQFEYKAKDLSTEISKVKAINSDVLLIVSRSYTTNLIIKELIAQSHNPKMIIGPANQGFFEKQFYDNFKEKSDYLYTVHAWMDQSSHLTKIAEDLFYKAYPDELFELNSAFSLEALYIAALAFKKAQSTKGEDLKLALQNLNESQKIMYGGNIGFDSKGQRQSIKLLTLMNKDQKIHIVNPKEIKQIEPVLPFPGFRK